MGVERVFDPSKVVIVADHLMPAKDIRAAEMLKALKEWCDRQGVMYYDQGRGGIEHTVLIEEGWVVPGSMIVGADSHSCTYGALGCVRHRDGRDRHRRRDGARELLADRPRHDRRRVRGREGRLRHGQGSDPRADRRDRRSRGDGHGARVHRRRRGGARASTSGWPCRTWRSRPGPTPGSSPPTTSRPPTSTGRTDRPWVAERSDDDAEIAGARPDRPRRAPAADRAAALARQRRRRSRTPSGARSTRSTSATARTGRSPTCARRPRSCAVGAFTATAARSSCRPRRRSTGRRSPRDCSTRSSRPAAS